MCHCKHLTLEDREDIMVMYIDGKSIADIADAIDRDKSTVSREVRRNAQGSSSKRSGYRARRAQSNYEERRRLCGRRRALEDRGAFDTVAGLFLEEQLSPERIEGRLVLVQGSSPASDGMTCSSLSYLRLSHNVPRARLREASAIDDKMLTRHER